MIRDFFSHASMSDDRRHPTNGLPRGGSGPNNSKKTLPAVPRRGLRRGSIAHITLFMVWE